MDSIIERVEEDLLQHRQHIIKEILTHVCQCDSEQQNRVNMLLDMLIMTQDKLHENRRLIEE